MPASVLHPLVEEMHAGYRCADLLLLLPGSIPIPSFWVSPTLEAQKWVDPQTQRFRPEIVWHLAGSSLPCSNELHPAVPFPDSSASNLNSQRCLGRAVIRAPLLVRLPTIKPSVYTPAGRSRFLSSIGIPHEFHDPHQTKILVISFGGQFFRKPPTRPASRSGRKSPLHDSIPWRETAIKKPEGTEGLPLAPRSGHTTVHEFLESVDDISDDAASTTHQFTSPRLVSSSHLWLPGAPPVMRTPSMPSSPRSKGNPTFAMALSPPTSSLDQGDNTFPYAVEEDEGPFLLPDSSWIAVVCGVSMEQWKGLESDVELPSGFFIAPRYVYMPDLMAAADVLLGKLVCLNRALSSVADAMLRPYRVMGPSQNVLIRVLPSYMVRSRSLVPFAEVVHMCCQSRDRCSLKNTACVYFLNAKVLASNFHVNHTKKETGQGR